jgi:hypothetical protein
VDDEGWLGSGPLDVIDLRSIPAGATGAVRIYPMQPSSWRDVRGATVLDLREGIAQTLDIAVVRKRIGVPDEAPLRLSAVPLRPNESRLVARLAFEDLATVREAGLGAPPYGPGCAGASSAVRTDAQATA